MNIETTDDQCDHEFIVGADDAGGRIDKYLAGMLPEYSRSRLQNLIDSGAATVFGKQISSSYKVRGDDHIVITIPPLDDIDPVPEYIPLDILFEDDDVIVINKPNGMVVHPAVGHFTGTLVNALLYHCGDTLSGINGARRPGIVHRLDKDTSGAMLVAKNDFAHQSLSLQLQSRELSRIYHAFCVGVPVPPSGSVDAPVGRHHNNRLKMTVTARNGREALTHYTVIQNFYDEFAMLECKLSTGRTHQIRVHCEHIKHPLIGDLLYGAQENHIRAALKRAGYEQDMLDFIAQYPYQALHARHISFVHPRSGDVMSFTAEYPELFQALYTRFQAS